MTKETPNNVIIKNLLRKKYQFKNIRQLKISSNIQNYIQFKTKILLNDNFEVDNKISKKEISLWAITAEIIKIY